MGAVDTDTFVRLVASMVIMLLVLVLVKRRARRGTGPSRGALRIEARQALGRSASVLVVAVGDKRWLVGAGEQGVTLLDRLEPGDLDVAEDRAGGDGQGPFGARRRVISDESPARRSRSEGDVFGAPPKGSGARALDDLDGTSEGPRTGLVDRMRQMTLRAPGRARSGGPHG